MQRRALLASVPAVVSAGCTIGGESPQQDALTLQSPAFDEELPERYTCDGDGVSPPLQVSGVPDGVESLAIVGEWLRGISNRTIWLLWNLPAEDHLEISEGIAPVEEPGTPARARQGASDGGAVGYQAPCHETPDDNAYRFNLLALSARPNLDAGADRDDFDDAVDGAIRSSTFLPATYERF